MSVERKAVVAETLPVPPSPASTGSAVRNEDTAPPFEQLRVRLSPLQDGAHRVEMRLSPESLGDLKIDLRIQSGRMDATVRAETTEARALLLRDEPALRQALHDGGITLSSFTVTVGGGGGTSERHASRTASGDGRDARRPQKDDGVEAIEPDAPGNAGPAGPGAPTHWIA